MTAYARPLTSLFDDFTLASVADGLAAEGYLVAVPKLLTPALDGGTDGDALPPDGAFNTSRTRMQHAARLPFARVRISPMIESRA